MRLSLSPLRSLTKAASAPEADLGSPSPDSPLPHPSAGSGENKGKDVRQGAQWTTLRSARSYDVRWQWCRCIAPISAAISSAVGLVHEDLLGNPRRQGARPPTAQSAVSRAFRARKQGGSTVALAA